MSLFLGLILLLLLVQVFTDFYEGSAVPLTQMREGRNLAVDFHKAIPQKYMLPHSRASHTL